jgi:hypothetical protein
MMSGRRRAAWRPPAAGTALHPEVLARFDFAPGRGYDRRSVLEFRASALAVIDELLAEREHGAGTRADHLSGDEQAMLAAFRLLDDERRADFLSNLFVLCAPEAKAVTSGHATGSSFDVPAASRAEVGAGAGAGVGDGGGAIAAIGRRAERSLGWPPPSAVAIAEAARRAMAAAWPPPGVLVPR